MYNVFIGWNFMERLKHRSVCFKGGSTEIPETTAQRASSEVALNEYNDYMKTILPFENKFMADVTAPTDNRQAQVAGMVGADVAQKVGTTAINPNQGINSQSTSDLATTLAKSGVKADQAVKAQQAAGLQSVIDMGRGQATTAQLGMSELAGQSVQQASQTALYNQAVDNASLSAGASALGI